MLYNIIYIIYNMITYICIKYNLINFMMIIYRQ